MINTQTILGIAIRQAFIDKMPTNEIIKTIKEAILDNRNAVINCIPEYIVENIEKYFPEIQPDRNDLQHVNI